MLKPNSGIKNIKVKEIAARCYNVYLCFVQFHVKFFKIKGATSRMHTATAKSTKKQKNKKNYEKISAERIFFCVSRRMLDASCDENAVFITKERKICKYVRRTCSEKLVMLINFH